MITKPKPSELPGRAPIGELDPVLLSLHSRCMPDHRRGAPHPGLELCGGDGRRKEQSSVPEGIDGSASEYVTGCRVATQSGVASSLCGNKTRVRIGKSHYLLRRGRTGRDTCG